MAEKQFEQTASSPDKFSLSELELELGSSEFLVLSTFLLKLTHSESPLNRLSTGQSRCPHAFVHEEAGPRRKG